MQILTHEIKSTSGALGEIAEPRNSAPQHQFTKLPDQQQTPLFSILHLEVEDR